MAFRAVLDACVLFPFSLRDTLLRLAERELYDVVWSDRILAEMTRNLIINQEMTEPAAQRLERMMRQAFEEAAVPAAAVEQLEPAMTNHLKDRHVLAAAVAAHAEVVVTSNLRDFTDEACAPLGVTAVHPDDFLLDLRKKSPALVFDILVEQAGDLEDPPMTLDDILDALSHQAPRFATTVRRASIAVTDGPP